MTKIMKKNNLLKRYQDIYFNASDNINLILVIFLLSLAYWIVVSVVDFYIFHKGSIIEAIMPSCHELCMRLFIILLFFLFGFYGRFLVTKRLKVEKDLEKVLHESDLILNSAGEGIWGLDRSGKVTFVNQAALEISGYEAQELIDHNIHQLLHFSKADGSPHPQEDCQIYTSLVNGEVRRVSEDWFRHKDGECFPVEYVTTAIKEGGQVTGAVVVFRDISARQQAEEELQKTRDFLENVLDNSADVIGIVDKHGKFIRWNKTAEKIYGYSFAELKGKPAFELYADQNELKKMLDQLRREGLVRRYEINMKKKDGRIVPFALSINYLYDQNKEIIGSICVARDQSDIRAAMAESKAVNEQLRAEIHERHQMEAALKDANDKLQGLVQESEQRTRDITLLNELGDLLQACRSREEAYAAVAQFGGQLFPDRTGSLFVLNASQNLLEAVAHWGESLSGEQVFTPNDCWAFRRGEVHRVAGSQTGLLCKHIPAPSTADHICIPMIAQGETIGMIHLQSSLCRLGNVPQEALGYLTDSKDRLALTLAKQISLALSSLNLRETLQWQAIRDPLTGLFNRRYMEESLKREMARVKRRGASLGVIMADLDYFKNFNDTYGHKAGDALLVALAALLKNHIRREDIACRYGGEEMLLILPETSLEITTQRAEELREQIVRLQVEYLGQPLGPITASLGVAAFPKHGRNWEELIQAADAALYRAKEEGRNRLVVAQDLKTLEAEGRPRQVLKVKTKMAKAR
jgi:diguanylate cyclase (GGDEF)-like protein/PAS domain S-box-containing protein